MRNFDDVYRTWAASGFGPIRQAWLAKAAGLGETLKVRMPRETISGVFDTISESGELKLRLPDGGVRMIAAGEVFFGTE